MIRRAWAAVAAAVGGAACARSPVAPAPEEGQAARPATATRPSDFASLSNRWHFTRAGEPYPETYFDFEVE